MFVVLLNAVLSIIVITIAAILTLIAIVLIIVSLVRSSVAKKNNKKTSKVGLWVGIAMLIIPWIVVAVFFVASKVSDAKNNRWLPGKEVLAAAVADRDAEELHDMFADYVVDEENLSVEDVEEFFQSIDMGNVSSGDIERYTDVSPDDNHYRNYTSHDNGRRQTCFQYNMYNVNDDGGRIYIAAVDGDPEGEEYVGIYYVSYTDDDGTISIGIQPPSEH